MKTTIIPIGCNTAVSLEIKGNQMRWTRRTKNSYTKSNWQSLQVGTLDSIKEYYNRLVIPRPETLEKRLGKQLYQDLVERFK